MMIEVSEGDVLQGLARRAREAFRARGARGVLVVRGSELSYNDLTRGDDGSEQAAVIRSAVASYDPRCEAVLHFLASGVPTTRRIRIEDVH